MDRKTTDHKPVVVFVHGFLGFSEIRVLWKSVAYFRGLKQHLADLGVEYYFPSLPPASSIKAQAAVLARALAKIPGDNIHLVAHSMGGLDSRYLIHHLDPDHRVRSLVTICTPHRGSPIADWMLDTNGPFQWIGQLWWREALEDLRPAACERFNNEIPDRSDVVYHSYAAARPVTEMAPVFRPWTRLIDRQTGDNDSQVSVSSATWGELKGVLRADHMEAIGWNFGWPKKRIQRPFNHLGFYRSLIVELLQLRPGASSSSRDTTIAA